MQRDGRVMQNEAQATSLDSAPGNGAGVAAAPDAIKREHRGDEQTRMATEACRWRVAALEHETRR